jgi:uncharacterized protein (DUF1015 family)
MAPLSPFRGWLVTPEAAPRVVAPAYDALSAEERRRLAAAEPDSFLNVMRSPRDEPDADAADPEPLLAASRAALERLLAEGAFRPIDRPAFLLLRMQLGDHVQTGVVGTVPVHTVGGTVRLHEETRTVKETDLVRHLEVVGVASSPIGLVHPGPSPLADLVAEATARAPQLDVHHDDGLRQQVWTVDGDDAIARVRDAFAAMPALYLTDGHHRAAAARQLAARRRAASGSAGPTAPDDPWEQLLVVVFPAPELRLYPYHRVVRDLDGRRPDDVLAAIRIQGFEVTARDPAEPADPQELAPTTPGCFALYLAGAWYTLRDQRTATAGGGPVAALDVTVLQQRILAPALGVHDARDDERLEVVPGPRGLAELARRAGPAGAAVAVPPPDLDQLMAVADAGAVMPPKSTWFEPKVRSGVLLRPVAPEAAPSATP